jgi:hypothetical protein
MSPAMSGGRGRGAPGAGLRGAVRQGWITMQVWQYPARTAAMAPLLMSPKLVPEVEYQLMGVSPSIWAANLSLTALDASSPQGSGWPKACRTTPSMSPGPMPASAIAAVADWIVSSL